MITQNKGEWSELYVFLKLLGDGVLYAADSDLNKNENLYYPLVEILRKDNKQLSHYIRNDKNIKIKDDFDNVLLELPCGEFIAKAELLFNTIKNSKSTFAAPDIENFMKIIKCSKVKADSMDKSDITLVLHDCKTYRNEAFGFSIKSRLGAASTLLNPGKSTNFIYEITGNMSDEEMEDINSIETKTKLQDRLKRIYKSGCKLKFIKTENENFRANLQMIDTCFPIIISEYLIWYYLGFAKRMPDLTKKIREVNPCCLNMDLPHLYYEHKIKNLLADIALGMTPATPWDGSFQSTGGYIIVREDGEVLCYHVYNRNEFRDYLYNNTCFDTASATRYKFGYIYEVENKKYIKLNLQIRFI